MKTIEQLINETTLLFMWTEKKAKKCKQLYKVDLSQIIKIGGLDEEGYKLTFYPENNISNMVITKTKLFKCMRGEILSDGTNTIQKIF
jgi:hypothetical protein